MNSGERSKVRTGKYVQDLLSLIECKDGWQLSTIWK